MHITKQIELESPGQVLLQIPNLTKPDQLGLSSSILLEVMSIQTFCVIFFTMLHLGSLQGWETRKFFSNFSTFF